MSFNILKKSDKLFELRNYFKDRDLSIIEFQMRLLDLAKYEDTPMMEKLNFLKIIISNLEEFISVRFQELNDAEVNAMIGTLESLYSEIAEVIRAINKVFGYHDDVDEVYTIIKNQDIKFIYSGESDSSIENEMNHVESDKTKKCDVALYYGSDEHNISADFVINVPKEILLINKNIDFYKESLTGCKNLNYPDDLIQYQKYDYYNELQERDMLFRVPYESYQMILDFIDQMCTNENITTVFISLYRTANDSKIIQSLIKARKLGKRVFVYIEPTARGNETRNIENIQLLRDNDINIQSSFFNYKVHSKIFCAIDKNYRKFIHIGTGNYNEDTSKFYTDTHLLSSNQISTTNVLEIFISLFTKNQNINFDDNFYIYSSPLNFRKKFNELIETEISKGENGRIFIKCNNLCDCEIIDKLYVAAKAGVQIKIICRTGCSIHVVDNIEIRSKVGKYLEHDRIYMFGDHVFISSADLLLRNLSKRVETLCEIKNENCKRKLCNLMNELFNDPLIHHMTKDGKWELKS